MYVNSFIVVTVLVMWCGERPKNIHTHTHISVVTVTAHHTSPQRDNHIAKIVRELVHRGNCCSDVLPRI